MKRRLHSAFLIVCVLLVSFWQVMAWRARRGFDPFRITAESSEDFSPVIPGFKLQEALVTPDPLQPNILCFRAHREGKGRSPHSVLIRLTHGYNMVDCMRIKHYRVIPLTSLTDASSPSPSDDGEQRGEHTADKGPSFPRETWRLVSPIEDESIWITSMHNSVTLAPMEISTTSMAFPRIGTVDEPGWHARGISLGSFRRPLHSLKRTLQHRWNNARCDLLTFLKLRRPVYASDEILTVVSSVAIPPANESNPVDVAAAVVDMQREVHAGLVRELMAYRGEQ